MTARSFIEKKRKILTRLLSFVLVLLILFSESYWEKTLIKSDIFFLFGIVLVGVATVGRLWCLLYISGYKTNTLIRWGPYSLCRNPLYFFSLLGGVGVGLASETLMLPGIILIGFALYYPLVIRAEERKLHNFHGKDFEDYMNITPRFFPEFRAFREPQEYTVKPKAFRKGLFDALWFVWLVGILELIEAFHEYDVLPVLFKLY
ncbi:MAG: isoprenylcysteine carboxylmethyltransferase family protein [Planctomycetes bacterium]|nr:isoprenylcysteine carboxylmethyltransferase family protein [Planctomycetota bacterium]MBL7146194.1 isoprenylcysteine carboxylmethyltransferase family protein [Phycisphaerae bacterium]